ncbi:histidine phosphatase family protein [Metabacillus litoralis]|uniref:histidine phosphatase family protein n=1 Tax=Metabacillus litoralis TaxID=152268 RepID=UPI001CFDB6AE|nr:histidine phosphatase family protein [Metabacillus litoralis]
MQFIFIRHGQGEHTLNLPNSLNHPDPSLTQNGMEQAKMLRNQFPLSVDDVLMVSPIRRTIQTAIIWSEGVRCRKIVTPLVSPRIFPQKKERSSTLPCNVILTRDKIQLEFADFHLVEDLSLELWNKGINTIPEKKFNSIAEMFLKRCRKLGKEKIYIVSHDGTITSYRQFITGDKLSREDFPKETGWFTIDC